jgi:nucleoside-diphosphate-sugar epimerase
VNVEAFEYVIHTACPYHFNFNDPVTDFIKPAVKGTTGLLQAVKHHAPGVKRIVLLSSSATILNPFNHSKIYDESIQGVTTWEEAMKPNLAYRASKVNISEAKSSLTYQFSSELCSLYFLLIFVSHPARPTNSNLPRAS